MTEFNTKLVHQPAQHDNNTGAVTVPIYKATTFKYPEVGAQAKTIIHVQVTQRDGRLKSN